MVIPTIHINGTARRDIEAALEAATNKLQDAIEALEAMCPNGRDYYPQGPDAFGRAETEHYERVRAVTAVRGDLVDMLIAVQEQA